MDILKMAEFDPRQTVVLQAEPDEARPAVEVSISAGVDLPGRHRWGTPEAREAVLKVLVAHGEIGRAAEVQRPNVNRLRLSAPGPGWLVVSERLKLFPGWSAQSSGQAVPIHRANAVLAAMAVPPDAVVDLKYRPPGFATGIGILLAGCTGLAAAIGVRLRRSRRT